MNGGQNRHNDLFAIRAFFTVRALIDSSLDLLCMVLSDSWR